MSLWVFTISWNEAVMMPFFLRHYSSIADRIIVWDEQSTDGTREMVRACPKAELRDWPHRGLDDQKFIQAVNTFYREARGQADWVMWPDVDEILYHPLLPNLLNWYMEDVVPAKGYALIGNGPVPSGPGQIYDYIKTGYPQDNYTKCIIWRPQIEIRHQIGRHDLPVTSGSISPHCLIRLLHCHYFSPEYTAARNRRNYARALDKKFAWNYAPGVTIRGTEHWVEELIKNNKLQIVV